MPPNGAGWQPALVFEHRLASKLCVLAPMTIFAEMPASLIEVGLGWVVAGFGRLVSAVSSDWVVLGWAFLHTVASS